MAAAPGVIKNSTPTIVKDHLASLTPMMQSPINGKDHTFIQSDDPYHQANHAGLVCLDASGTELWRSGHHYHQGSLLVADGLIFSLHGEAGTLHLIDATTDTFTGVIAVPLATVDSNHNRGFAWAPMALANGHLYVRDMHGLHCLDVRE